MKVSITPKEIGPGGTITVNVNIQPPVVTQVIIRDFGKQGMTDGNGVANLKISVPQKAQPDRYDLYVEAPDLGLKVSDTYTVSLTGTNTAFNVGTVGLNIGIKSITVEGTLESDIYNIGGKYFRGELTGNEFKATGSSSINEAKGTFSYVIRLNNDFSQASGSLSFKGERGETCYFNFGLPRNKDKEDELSKAWGVGCLVYYVEGGGVTGYFSSFSATDPYTGGKFSSIFVTSSSKLAVILIAATDEQIGEILNN